MHQFKTLFERIIREELASILEGGLKLKPEHRRDLTPALIFEAGKVYRDLLEQFNQWLKPQGVAPVTPVRPSGSATHAEKDAIDRPDATYGDIDYLVSFPVDYTSDDLDARRKEEAASRRKYLALFTEFLKTERPQSVDVDATLKGIVWQVLIKIPSGGMVQIDTVETHPDYSEWMKGRYSPERGIKGYVTGNLYKALGDYLTLTVSTEGVVVRIKDGKRVPSGLRAGVTIQNISNDFRNFFQDIADYLIGSSYESNQLLADHPGVDPDNVNVGDIAKGIVGLAQALNDAGIYDKDEMLNSIYASFVANMEDNVDRKVSREITPEQEQKLRKLNKKQAARVKSIFDGVDLDRSLMKEIMKKELRRLQEGGNAFESVEPISMDNYKATWPLIIKLLKDCGVADVQPIGSTGKKLMTGDLDIAIQFPSLDNPSGNRDELYQKLVDVLGPDSVRKLPGYTITMAYPVYDPQGNETDATVQVDMMIGKTSFLTWGRWGSSNIPKHPDFSIVKGVARNILFSTINRYAAERQFPGQQSDVDRVRYALDSDSGLFINHQTRRTDKPDKLNKDFKTVKKEFVTDNPDEAVELMFGKGTRAVDIRKFEDVVKAVKSSPLLKDIADEILLDFAADFRNLNSKRPMLGDKTPEVLDYIDQIIQKPATELQESLGKRIFREELTNYKRRR